MSGKRCCGCSFHRETPDSAHIVPALSHTVQRRCLRERVRFDSERGPSAGLCRPKGACSGPAASSARPPAGTAPPRFFLHVHPEAIAGIGIFPLRFAIPLSRKSLFQANPLRLAVHFPRFAVDTYWTYDTSPSPKFVEHLVSLLYSIFCQLSTDIDR